MTDYLEPYRQMVRAIRFAPPQGQHERFNRLVHQPLPVPPVRDPDTAEVARGSFVALDPGPTLDPSEHAAALVRGAVSKHTVLPVTYSIQENVGDRISRLATPKQAAPLIIAPKIPAPDPNWTPPPPPPIQHLVIATPAQTEVPVASELVLPQTETPVDLNQVPTTVGETEDLSPQEPESLDLNQLPTIVVEFEDLSPQEPDSIDLNQIPTIVVEFEDLSLQEPDSIDLNQIPTIVVEFEDLSPQEPESLDSNQIPTTGGEIEDLSPQEIQPLDLSQATATVENETVIAEKETPVDLNQIHRVVQNEEVANQENQPLQDSQIETNFVENEEVVAQESQPIELSQVSPTVESELAAQTVTPVELSQNTATVESESAISEPEIAAEVSPTATSAVETEEVATQDNQPVELNQTLTTDESESAVSQLEPLPIVESKKSKSEKLQITCPKCNSGDVRKNGRQKDRQKYLCKDCGRQFVWAGSVEEKVNPQIEAESEPKPADEVFTSKPKSSKGKVKKQSKGFGRNKR